MLNLEKKIMVALGTKFHGSKSHGLNMSWLEISWLEKFVHFFEEFKT